MTTALLVIDMQNAFEDMVSKALPQILKLHAFFTSTSKPVIFTQHGHPPEDLRPPFRNQLVRRWGVAGSIATGSHDWAFLPAIRPLVDEEGPAAVAVVVVAKNTYDAFIGTDLEHALRAQSVERVVVCGVMTDCCCETTARSAFNRGWETWFVRDAMGSATEEQHERAIADYGFGYGPVLGTDDVIALLRNERTKVSE